MTIVQAVALLVLTMGFAAAARADEPYAPHMPKPEAGPATVFTFGRENPDCAEWTDACQACVRAADGNFHCTTVGIACTPGPPMCSVKKLKTTPAP